MNAARKHAKVNTFAGPAAKNETLAKNEIDPFGDCATICHIVVFYGTAGEQPMSRGPML